MASPKLELLLTAAAAALSPTTLTFSVLALVLGERPRRTGAWFLAGAFTATMAIGVLAAFVLGNAAASPQSSHPKTWVAVLDVGLGVAALLYAARLARRRLSPAEEQKMVDRCSAIASSRWIAIVGAGAALANPGGFIPVALKDLSQLDLGAAEFVALWLAFTAIALLPLISALVLLTLRRAWAMGLLESARAWLMRNATRLGAALVAVLAVVLLRNGIAGLLA